MRKGGAGRRLKTKRRGRGTEEGKMVHGSWGENKEMLERQGGLKEEVEKKEKEGGERRVERKGERKDSWDSA